MSLDRTPPANPNHAAPRVSGRVGPYEILGELGRGTTGQVFRVRDAAGRELALKLLGTARPESVRRFEREGKITASLCHPGIVAVHAAGTIGDRPYLVYELVSGASLEDRLPTLDRPTRLRLLQEVAEAVGYAHSQGVLHRDLKPANVVVDAGGHARVVDFGLAQVAGIERMTRTGAWIGSPLYMSPEQIAGARSRFGPATDVWALGVMLYLALGDRVPFGAHTVAELIAEVTSSAPPSLRGRDRSISPALEAVCLRALAKAPEERFANGAEFAAALAKASDVSRHAAPYTPPEPGLAKSNLPLGLVLGALVLGGLIFAFWVVTRGEDAGPAPPPAPTVSPSPPAEVSPRADAPERLIAQAIEAAHALDQETVIRLMLPLLEREGLSLELQVEARELLAAAYAEQAEALRRAKDYSATREALERASALAPNLTVVLLERAWSHHDQGEPESALVLFARALQRNPTQASGHFGRGVCPVRLQRYPEARAALKQAVELNPKRRYALNLARVCKHLSDAQGLDHACSVGLEAGGPVDDEYVALLLERARARLTLDDAPGVVTDCSELLDLVPTSDESYRLRGQARSRLGNLPLARADLERALELDPQQVENVHELVHHLQREEDVARQLELTREAVEAFPGNAHLRFDRALAHYANRDFPAARADLDALLAWPAGLPDPLRKRVHLRRAAARAYEGPAGVRDDLRAAFELGADPMDRLRVQEASAETYCLLGWPQEALAELHTIPRTDLVPRRQRALASDLLGAYLVAGNHAAASEELRRLLRLHEEPASQGYALVGLGALGDASTRTQLAELPPDTWLGRLAAFLLGDGETTQLFADARALDRPYLAEHSVAERECEAHFYAALAFERRGAPEAARLHYWACLGTGVMAYNEFHYALGRLRFLARH